MKNIFKKNQMMIAALALMIAVAGYLNFNSNDLAADNPKVADTEETVDADGMDVSANYYDGAIGNSDDALISANLEDTVDADQTSEGVLDDNPDAGDSINTNEIGETVLTSGSVTENFLSQAKLNREQMRAKSKEILNGIIENESLSEEAKKDAVRELIELTEAMQKETEAEQQLGLKGFVNAVVSISENSVDVSVAQTELSDAQRAQIEDIVMRKTGCEITDIIITTMGSQE